MNSEISNASPNPRAEAVASSGTGAWSDRQVAIIRDALLAYKAYTSGPRGSEISWNAVAAEINAHADVLLHSEIFRQFAKRERRRGRERVPTAGNLQIIVDFLMDPEIGALSLEQLDDTRFHPRLPQLLSKFLMQEFDTEPVRPPSNLMGSYQGKLVKDDWIFVHRLSLEETSGAVRVVERADCLKNVGQSDDDLRAVTRRTQGWKSHLQSEGWCIVTPEDNLLFLMKEMPSARNHYWHLTTDAKLWRDNPVSEICLLHQDYPAEVNSPVHEASFRNEITSVLMEKTAVFVRTKDQAGGD